MNLKRIILPAVLLIALSSAALGAEPEKPTQLTALQPLISEEETAAVALEIEDATPLMLAARDGQVDEIRRLIAEGADVNATNKSGVTALHCAIFFSENTDAALALLDAGADINAVDKKGWSPLLFATYKGRPRAFIEELLKRGAYPEGCADDGTSPMMYACQNADDVMTIVSLYNAGAEVALPRNDGEHPLHFAARNMTDAAPAIIRFLIDNRANILCRNGKGMMPLMSAALYGGRNETIDALLQAGATINARDWSGMTPLMLAAASPSENALTTAKKLAECGADFDAQDNFGRTPFLVAVRSGHSLAMVRWLHEVTPQYRQARQEHRLAVLPAAISLKKHAILPPPEESLEGTEVADAAQETTSPTVDAITGEGESTPATSEVVQETELTTSATTEETTTSADAGVETPATQDAAVEVPALESVAAGSPAVPNETAAAAELTTAPSETVTAAELPTTPSETVAAVEQPAQPGETTPAPSDESATGTGTDVGTTTRAEELAAAAEDVTEEDVKGALEELKGKATKKVPSASGINTDKTLQELKEAIARASGKQVETPREDAEILEEEQEEVQRPPYDNKATEEASQTDGDTTETRLITILSQSARKLSRPAMEIAQIRRDETLRPFQKRRRLKKLKPQLRTDRARVTPLMLAAVNPNEAARDIIFWLIGQGEDLEAVDGDGRTALVCAVRYGTSPIPALALIDAGANTRATYRNSGLRRLLRFNDVMLPEDKRLLADAIKAVNARPTGK